MITAIKFIKMHGRGNTCVRREMLTKVLSENQGWWGPLADVGVYDRLIKWILKILTLWATIRFLRWTWLSCSWRSVSMALVKIRPDCQWCAGNEQLEIKSVLDDFQNIWISLIIDFKTARKLRNSCYVWERWRKTNTFCPLTFCMDSRFLTRVQPCIDGSVPEPCLRCPLFRVRFSPTDVCLNMHSLYKSLGAYFSQIKPGIQANLAVLFMFSKTNFLLGFYTFVECAAVHVINP